MTKKLMSLLLSIFIIMSFLGTSVVFANDNETEILGPGAEDKVLPEVAEGCNRYFFYMPKSWENEYSQTAGIYWWENTGAQDSHPGVEAHKADADGLYYYDVPTDVCTVMWNNFLDGGSDTTSPEYKATKLTGSICTEYYEPGESELYPDGLESFNNMVWVVDYSDCYCMEFDVRGVCGEWYYYYGNGEYGTTPDKGDVVYTERTLGGEYCRHERPTYSDTLPELSVNSNRYFFYMPDSWQYESRFDFEVVFDEVGIAYLEYADAEGIFFCDLPKNAKEFYIINGDEKVCSTSPAPVVPDFKLQDCDGKILVIDPSWTVTSIVDGKNINYGFWYYYYGNGEYGETPKEEEFEYPPVAEGCNRYFFYMPKSWENEYSQTAGIYWWEGTGAQSSWPGVEAHKADAENVYYYDVPKDVERIIWNNYVQLSPDLVVGPEYSATRQTHEVDVGEYMIFDEMCDYVGMGNHDGDIYVTREKCFCDDYPECQKSSGMFYTYNGKGEYRGVFPDREIKTSTEPVIDNHGGYQRPYVKGYNRFFFYMPDEWCTDCSSVPGAYWNTETSSSDEYPGTPMKPTDIEGMYYIDIPASVDEFYFTNLVDGGTDIYAPIYAQEIKAHSRPYYADDSFLLEECNGMVFVVNHAWYDYSEYDGKLIFEGMWFEYYGFGEYGYLGGEYGLSDVYTNKSFNDYYFNPIVHPYFIGDTDGDGIVSVKDATAIQKHLADIKSCNVIEGDVDNNGLNIKDATAIQKYVAGIEVDAPISTIQYR